jgi:hypothetical protein
LVSRLSGLRDLDQVSAGVGGHSAAHGADLGRLLGELDAECPQPLELVVQVIDGEGGERDPVTGERRLEGRLR